MKTTDAAPGGECPRSLNQELRAADAGRIRDLAGMGVESEVEYVCLHLEGIELALKGMQEEDIITSPRVLIALVQSAQDRCAGILAAMKEARLDGAGAS